MESPNISAQDARLKRDEDAIAILQDAVPQLESLFVISHSIGTGTFSSVYFGRTKHTTTINGRRHFAIKHIIPTSHPSRIYMELKCLKMMGGTDNVMGVTMCFREMNHIVIVMPYFPHDSFSDYVGCLKTDELQEYLRNLLIALRRVHSFRIIHRDVKPANFLFNRKLKRYSLVDFGLAQEVGMVKTNALSQLARSVIGKGGGATRVLSPPTIDTPHLSSNKTAKRKLSVCHRDDTDNDKNKRTRHFSPPTSASGGVLSSTTNRVNTALRRSPRKQCSLVSPKKENQITPRNGNLIPSSLQDSPSKHTRNSESLLKSGSLKDSNSGKTPNLKAQMRQEAMRALRRSPRKSVMSAEANVQLEGLAKHLQEASALNVTAKTPNMRPGSSKLDATPSGDSSCTSKAIVQRDKQKNGAGCSPRVSGITNTPVNSDSHGKSGRVLQEVRTKTGSVLQSVSCHCYGSARVCSVCLGRSGQQAPRAGTPGFRAPEVLLRHPDQGTAVDMWSVGVILLCLLSGRYPFFKAADDLSTLAEISTLLGTYSIRKAASKMGKLYTCSEERKPLDLGKVCDVLRNNTLRDGEINGKNDQKETCPGCRQSLVCVCVSTTSNSSGQSNMKSSQSLEYNLLKEQYERRLNNSIKSDLAETPVKGKCSEDNQNSSHVQESGETPESPKQSSNLVKTEDINSSPNSKKITYPYSVYHLLLRLLDPDPETRITAEEALIHPFFESVL